MKPIQLVYIAFIIYSLVYVFINQKYSKRITIVNGYVEEFSVNRGDDVVAYLQPMEEHKKGVVLIYNLKGKIVDSVVCNLRFQDTTKSKLFYEKGYEYNNGIAYNTSKLKSGIYYINKIIPFIVKEPLLKKAITVVFPYANMHALCNDGGKSFYGYSSSNNTPATALSLHRNLLISDYSLLFLNWMDSVYKCKNINIITDLDLEEYSNISNSKVLVIYGFSAFWTSKSRKNFDLFQKKGNNILAISSSLMNNKFRYDGTKKTILFFANSKYDSCTNAEYKTGQWCDVLINNPNINSVGCSYEINIGDKATLSFGGFKLLNQKHKIFKNLLCNFLPIKDATYNCTKIITPPIKSSIIADSTFGNFYSKEILAYDFGTYNQLKTIGGIFLFRKTKLSGQLLIIGSEQWLENNNFKNADLQTVTKNCVDLLM